jgi:hypothetical protein
LRTVLAILWTQVHELRVIMKEAVQNEIDFAAVV